MLFDCPRGSKLKRVLMRCLRIFSWVKNQVKNVVLVLRGRALYIVIYGLEIN